MTDYRRDSFKPEAKPIGLGAQAPKPISSMDDDTVTPIVVPASPAAAQVGAAVAQVLLVVATLPALVAVLGTRDVVKIVAYLQSAEFAPALGVVVAAGLFVWRQWSARMKHGQAKVMAENLPDKVAVVK